MEHPHLSILFFYCKIPNIFEDLFPEIMHEMMANEATGARDEDLFFRHRMQTIAEETLIADTFFLLLQ